MIIHTASWCPDCVRELKLIDQMVKNLKDQAPQLTYIKNYEDREQYTADKKIKNFLFLHFPVFLFTIKMINL